MRSWEEIEEMSEDELLGEAKVVFQTMAEWSKTYRETIDEIADKVGAAVCAMLAIEVVKNPLLLLWKSEILGLLRSALEVGICYSKEHPEVPEVFKR